MINEIHYSRRAHTINASSILLLSLLPFTAFGAYQYDWSGPASGGSWGNVDHWTLTGGSKESDDFGVPVQRTEAYLQNTAVDRNVVIDSTTFTNKDGGTTDLGWIRHVFLNQSSAATNQFTVDTTYFRIGNDLTLEATGGGKSKLLITNERIIAAGGTAHSRLDLGDSGGPVRFLYVGNGGVLEFGGVTTSTNEVAMLTRGDVRVTSGGQIVLQDGLQSSTTNSISYSLNNNLSLDGGEIVFGAAPSSNPNNYASITDVRLSVLGSFSAKDTTFTNLDPSKKRQLWLRGNANEITGNSSLDAGIDVVMSQQGNNQTQRLESSAALNDIYLRTANSGTVVLDIADIEGGNVGMVALAVGSGRHRTLRLENDLTTRAGVENALRAANLDGTSGEVTYTIDTNGHTYDISAMETRWFANRASSNVTKANWNITGGGTFITRAINLNDAGVSTSIGDNTTVVIKGGATNSNFNRLDSNESGTISATSTIVYDGGSNLAQITSNRQIGKLVVLSGVLEQSSYGDGDSYNFTAAGGIEIGAEGRLRMLGGRVIYAQDITFVINGSQYGSMSANSYNLDGVNLVLSFEGVATLASYDFFNGTALSGRANSVLLGGTYNVALSYDAAQNLWVGNVDDVVVTFSDETGLLTVVPEPSLVAALIGFGCIGMLALRRRR